MVKLGWSLHAAARFLQSPSFIVSNGLELSGPAKTTSSQIAELAGSVPARDCVKSPVLIMVDGMARFVYREVRDASYPRI
jgi:hypothetical protein